MKLHFHKLLAGVAALMLFGCSPKIVSNLYSSYPALTSEEEVLVIEADQEAPASAENLGSIKIGDSGFTSKSKGSYEEVLRIAKDLARSAGGNIVKINSHQAPDFYSTIHRIQADILLVPDLSSVNLAGNVPEVSDHPEYALVYFYRISSAGPLINYQVSIGDTRVFNARVNARAEVKIYEAGDYEIWGRTESRSSINLHVEPGRDYYVRCSVTFGAFVGRPLLEQVSPNTGKNEYQSLEL